MFQNTVSCTNSGVSQRFIRFCDSFGFVQRHYANNIHYKEVQFFKLVYIKTDNSVLSSTLIICKGLM